MSIENEIIEKMKEFETIIIHRHQRPDPDAIGSQAGLGEIIKTSFPKKRVLLAGNEIDGLEFMATMDKVTEEDYKDALAIIVDTGNTPRIDGDLYSKAKNWIKIDHHPNDEPYGDICYVDTSASSCSEIIARLYFNHQEELKLSDNGARLLYGGIVGDTGRFMFPSSTATTLAIASKLREFDFDAALLNREIDQVPVKMAKLFGYVYDHLKIDENGAGLVIIPKKVMDEYGIKLSEAYGVVQLPGKFDSVQAWAILVEQEDGTYRVNLRSKGPIINELAKAHDGGGHPLASGAKAKDLAEIEVLYKELEEIVKNFNN